MPVCVSCNKNLVSEDNFTQFKCPKCGETTIVRCEDCRRKSVVYVCEKCGFEGP